MKTMKKFFSFVLVLVIAITSIPSYAALQTERDGVDSSSTIKVGDTITLGTYLGEPIVWCCVGYDDNGPLMLSEKILCFKSFDAKGDHGNSIRNGRGTNNWNNSCLRHWLNSYDVVSWTDKETIPDVSNVYNGYNPYAEEIGFLSSFSDDELNIIKEVSQKTHLNSLDSHLADGGTDEHLLSWGTYEEMFENLEKETYNKMYQISLDRIFLLDFDQLCMTYNNLGADYLKPTATIGAVNNDSSLLTDTETRYSWWMRTPGTYGMSYENVYSVFPWGAISGMHAISTFENEYYSVGVRPAFYLDLNAYNENVQSDDISELQQEFIQQHLDFVSSNKYSNLTTDASFYNSIWKHEEDSRNFTCYAAWDVIGRVGKFAALDFYGTFHTDNPYDVVLVDVFRDYVNNENSKSVKAFETNFKTIVGAPSKLNDALDILKKSDAWNSELTKDWKNFTDKTRKDWIKGIFLKPETFELNDYDPEVKDLYNALSKILKNMNDSDFEKIFKGLKNTETICDYIGTGADIVFRFFDAYQKYLIAEALCATNEYVLHSVEIIAKTQMTGDNSKLLLDALDPYWTAYDTDSAFLVVNSFAAENGFIGSGVDTMYTYLGKGLLKKLTYAAIHSVTGLPVQALTATYNLTYMCLDYLSGLGKLTETHKLMNAAALLEKEYLELVQLDAKNLSNDKTKESAIRFDTEWGFLQVLEGYCYKTMSAYTSAFKEAYKSNYVINSLLSRNLVYALIKKVELSEKLASCDAAIQAVVYMESEWKNANCHNGIYLNSNLITVKCPTDVNVYDESGKLVLSIIDNKVTVCAGHVTAFVDGDEKICVLPTDQKYDVEITATGNGVMDYAVKSFGEIEHLRTIRYDDVNLSYGSRYIAGVPSKLYVETKSYDIKTDSGTTIGADFDSYYESIDSDTTDPITICLLGDVNGDGKVNIKDATMIQKAAAKIIALSDAERLSADVNNDTKVNVKDATAIQKFVAKIETGYPISKPII